MKLDAYLKTLSVEQRRAFAAACGTSDQHMKNVAAGKTCGEKLAIEIDKHSGGLVTCEEMRGDVDWAYLRASRTAGMAALPTG